jgi:hypothetical protein
MQEALENFVRHAAIPPVVAGLKLAPDDNRLPALLEAWVERLPEKIPRDKFSAGEHGEFTRVRLPVLSFVPREAAVRARDILAANIGDPYAATYLIRDLMAKSTTLCFGRARGYFLVTVGLDDPREALAPDFADSLPANGVLDRVAPRLGPGQAALLYADPLIVSLAAAPPPVGEYLDAAMESALEFAPSDAIRSLRTAAAPLRGQAEELFRPRVAALGGVVRETEGRWSAELFGGSLAPRLALGNARPLLAADPRMAVIWTEHWEADYAARVARFAAGASAFAEEWLETLGPVFLETGARDRMGWLLGMLAAAWRPLGGDTVNLLEKAVDHHVADRAGPLAGDHGRAADRRAVLGERVEHRHGERAVLERYRGRSLPATDHRRGRCLAGLLGRRRGCLRGCLRGSGVGAGDHERGRDRQVAKNRGHERSRVGRTTDRDKVASRTPVAEYRP